MRGKFYESVQMFYNAIQNKTSGAQHTDSTKINRPEHNIRMY